MERINDFNALVVKFATMTTEELQKELDKRMANMQLMDETTMLEVRLITEELTGRNDN